MISRMRETARKQTIEWDTLDDFLDKFHNAFTPMDKTRSAMNEIQRLRQKPKIKVETIINRFKLLVGHANLGTETELDHTHLISLFQKSILPTLANKIITIQRWYKKVKQFNTNHRLAQIFKEETEEQRRTQK
ncbi:hypothetical protein CVT25_001038 [Psilocybe cyanescens]|uniref:Retrotransposon gag domain-containing protein n=1 Tax=Psilocybe cyanescens TaxID=93625 RepID=A0A409X8K0_PSICY|nr:hypothetical protein CVT25_001038 [Psilocybe cyanescens]